MTDPLIGKQLDEYTLEKLLGQGGMARVYRALDNRLLRYAAIKVIDTPHRQDEAYISRFEREAQAIAQLDQPHIVTLYRYGNVGKLLYLAMQYIEGADLHVVLNGYEQDREFMEFDDVARLLSEIGSAVDYAHSRGVIHRDIKPSNVLLDAQGRAYLTDFGLALLTDVGTRGEILGSPKYIAPEQAVSSAGAVNQTDVYAMGVILYRMLTGRVPFEHEDTLALLKQHMTKEPPAPRQLRADISPALETVMLKALAKDPEDRYATARELAEAVEQAMADKATSTPFAGVVSTLSILDRVALKMEALPPPPVAEGTSRKATPPDQLPPVDSPPAVTSPPDVSLPAATKPKRPPLLWTAAGVGIALLLVAAWLLFGAGDEEATEIVNPPVPSPTPFVSETTEATEVVAAQPPSPETVPTGTTAVSATEPLPTETAVPEPTESPLPESTSPPPTAAPTAVPAATPSGTRLIMFYDPTSFYLYNPNRDTEVRVSGLSFESLDANGLPSGQWFEGRRWSQFYSFVESFGCVGLEITGEDRWLRPSQCRVFNAVITPDQEGDIVFWTQRPGVTRFRVLWQEREIGLCDVNATQCEAYLP